MLTRTILLALLGLGLTAPVLAQTVQPCRITGNVKGLGNKSVVFLYDHNNHQLHDTVRAVNDRFTYTTRPSDDGVINMKLVPSRYTPIWNEPGRVTVAGDMENVGQLVVTGTPENDWNTQYNQRSRWKLEQRMEAHPDSMRVLQSLDGKAARAFIQAHPQARTSANLLYEQARFVNDQPVETYEQLLRGLSPKVRASMQGQAAASRLTALRNQPQVGRPAPKFTIPDTAGVAVSLDTFKGKYVLLDFWGHWCGPCIQSMPHLKEIQARYASQMAVVGIGVESIDEKNLWLQAIHKHQLRWTQLSELKADKGMIEQYNIEGFPTYILLDKQGVVLVKSNHLAVVEEKLKALTAMP
ncbi:TlpA disulfide reductase family protein [Hymenobacter profundi]|uniref:AhpC/TSA family protein n=1 Tax=Hymenobacter profundi TaxID=1982110 RepID=A0ABS6X530_9BACT|nr:TlpA disulfide reductase family protein [Hymenobacter profundi]MBW3130049.1 AhpC/TSA family protein [Hymenobacter profundi]